MRSIMRKSFINLIIYIISIFVFILIYQCLSLGYDNMFVPSAIDIFKSLGELLITSDTWLYLGNTLLHLLISLIISFLIGGLLGFLAGIYKPVWTFFKPWSAILKSVPLVVSIILIMLLRSRSETPYIVCSIMIIPIIYEAVREGIINIDPALINNYKLDSKINFRIIIRVYFPLIMSYLRTAFVLAVGMGIKAVIMAEYLAGVTKTLGYAIIPASNNFDYSAVYAYSIIMVITVLILEAIPSIIYKIFDAIKFKKAQKDKM